MKSTGIVFSARSYIGSAEPPATVLEDESRFGNDGTFLGDGEPDWVQLPSGLWVMQLDGTDDEVTFTTINPITSGTVGMWVYRDDTDGTMYLFRQGNGYCYWGNNGNRLYISAGITVFVDGVATDPISGAGAAAWHHLVFSGVTTTAGTFRLGRHSTGSPFDGRMGLPEFYTFALSVDEAAAIFQAERHWFGV